MKKFLTILIILLAISIPLAVWYVKKIWDKINFTVYFISADLKGLTLSDIPGILSSNQEKIIKVTLGLRVKNDTDLSLTFGNLRAKLYFSGNLIGQTSESLANEKFNSQAHSQDTTPPITDVVDIALNQASARLLIDKIGGTAQQIDYEIYFTIFGLPITKIVPIKGNFTW